jgi:hypothetical protein
MSSKSKYDKAHFLRRFHQRFGYHMAEWQYAAILDDIHRPAKERIGVCGLRFETALTGTRTLWSIDFLGTRVYIIYNKNSKQLVTALPRGSYEEMQLYASETE